MSEKDVTALSFARSIINGRGGLKEFEERELATSPYPDRIAVVMWTLRCLANPRCKGSQEAIEAILSRREESKNV